MKKRPFLLLEILLAFLLVVLCLVPLISQPLKLYKKDLVFLEELERERLADWTFTEIKEKLLKNEIPWKKIPQKGVLSAPFSLPSATLEIPGSSPKTIERTFTLFCRGEKEGLQEEIYRSIWIAIELNPKLRGKKKPPYRFRLTIQQLPAAPTP